jgi:hypothetical protein
MGLNILLSFCRLPYNFLYGKITKNLMKLV